MTDCVAVVTGANKGIGRAVAERLLRDGYALGFVTHSEDTQTADELREHGTLHHVWGDLADPEAPTRIVGDVADHFGRLDVLVNNAGLTTAKPALELTADDFDSTFDVDVRAALLASQEAARRMQDGGVIVNVTSVHELVPRPGFVVYAAAKAALGMLTRGLALELAPSIRVVAVAPGAIATERNLEADELKPEIPLGRPGTPEEVAAVVAWVCSSEASYITGTSIVVDGALTQQVVGLPAGE
ncbi:MAG TPA: SDR family oxidoreductase [Gaiellaceae bacterium]|nr:SDR family oxidoreductase [Gaiellaceae bacterium]